MPRRATARRPSPTTPEELVSLLAPFSDKPRAALLAALVSAGVQQVDAYYVDGPILRPARESSAVTNIPVYVAADIGLISLHVLGPPRGHIRTETCPWSDVVNPELTVITTEVDQLQHRVAHLLVQLPRIDITVDNFQRPYIFENLIALARTIMLHKP